MVTVVIVYKGNPGQDLEGLSILMQRFDIAFEATG